VINNSQIKRLSFCVDMKASKKDSGFTEAELAAAAFSRQFSSNNSSSSRRNDSRGSGSQNNGSRKDDTWRDDNRRSDRRKDDSGRDGSWRVDNRKDDCGRERINRREDSGRDDSLREDSGYGRRNDNRRNDSQRYRGYRDDSRDRSYPAFDKNTREHGRREDRNETYREREILYREYTGNKDDEVIIPRGERMQVIGRDKDVLGDLDYEEPKIEPLNRCRSRDRNRSRSRSRSADKLSSWNHDKWFQGKRDNSRRSVYFFSF
jgi:hypothetical protein